MTTIGTNSPNNRKQRQFHDLMQHRVREVLLVSSLYDSYILQEDGHLTEKVYMEYETLSLSSAPRFTHVDSGAAALELMNLRRFDLVLVVTRLLDMDVTTFARRVKDRPHGLPVVLLAFNNRDLKRLEEIVDDPAIDGVFTWNGDAKILLAISKFIEDRLNIDHDIAAADVRVILVVEDSIRYYSSFLSVLYPELMMQSQSLFSEGMNRLQRLMRMRTRPKVLLARNYEQATEVYERYADNLIAVISDAGFWRDGEYDPDAGVGLLGRIRAEAPELPILLQSSEQKYAALEPALGVLFVNKHSQRLLQRIRSFLRDYLGFGPFIFRMPDGTEIRRAEDVSELEQCIREVPAASLEYHASRNHFSNWLVARSEFAMAAVMRPQQVTDFDTAEDMRTQTLGELRNLRRGTRAGVISDLTRAVFETEGLFTRLSTGSLGGKARGLAFMNHLLAGDRGGTELGGMAVRIPQCFALATDAFDEFLEQNHLDDVVYDTDDDNEIARAFSRGALPYQVTQDLRMVLANVNYPLAIRSSSLLEDNMLHPFAGIYGSVMLANSAPSLEIRLYELEQAIKYIYATTFFGAARAFLKSARRRTEEEKMGVVIQQLMGRTIEDRFYPHCSGMAHSYDFYALGDRRPEDGAVQLALGFGRIIMEGGSFVRFCPRHPDVPSGWSDTSTLVHSSQRWFYALDVAQPLTVTNAHPESPLRLHDLDAADRDGVLQHLASTYDDATGSLSEDPDAHGTPVVTFRRLLGSGEIPIAEALAGLLDLVSDGMGSALELEFACDLGRIDPDSPGSIRGAPTLYALHARPMITRDLIDDRAGEIVDPGGVICRSDLAVGTGHRVSVSDIVYVRPHAYDPAHTPTIAEEVSRLNRELADQDRGFVLVGPGRWGSANHRLGIPVCWQDISSARVIVEASPPDFAVEPSQGTHFFNNILSIGVSYFIVPPPREGQPSRGFVDWTWLESRPAAHESRFLRHVRIEHSLVATIDGRRGVGTIARRRRTGTPKYDHLSARR